mgnify:CR=1 FL=1
MDRGIRRRERDHPRIRGEHILVHIPSATPIGSSPHTRGARRRRPGKPRPRRIIPAYAGSTPWFIDARGWLADHPRIRGEHTYGAKKIALRRGSSPHTRGALPCGILLLTEDRDHPRIRGEHVHVLFALPEFLGSSPHTRGARDGRQGAVDGSGIIPAYAGSTDRGVQVIEHTPDHPRIRGEHKTMHVYPPVSRGSSPHTRGAPAGACLRPAPGRIIPAYAGSTSPTCTPCPY